VLVALLMASVLAGGVTYFFFRRVRLSNAQRRVTQVVAASSDLTPGVTLSAKDLTLVDWPLDMQLPSSFTKTEDVVGRPLLYPMEAREPILKRDLAAEGSGIGLASKIPLGMRATAVRSNEIVGVAGFLFPGSRVDVLATYTQTGNLGPLTQTILQDVEVLTAGQTTEPDPQGKPETVNVVTLLLNPEDSQKLTLASAQGTVQFVLRSGVDQKDVAVHATRLDQLLASERPPAPPPETTTKKSFKPASPPPPAYAMEVIQGTERSVQKF
jgi:pilus assembly protein CpaB